MRVHFNLQDLEPLRIDVEGISYPFASLEPLARKMSLATNINEFVYKLPSGKYVCLTVVGDEDQTSAFGVSRGWYVAEILSEKDALWLIKALEPFTKLYE